MRANRRFLYWGVFLLAVGGVLVASDLRAVETATLTDVLRLWPLAAVAIGLSIVLRKSRFSVPGLLIGSAIPGLVLGSAFAVAPRFPDECGARDAGPAAVTTSNGTFDGPATITVRSACGALDIATAPVNGWRLDAGNTAGRTPTVESTARALDIDAGGDHDGTRFGWGRHAWNLIVPTTELAELDVVVTIGRARLDLAGADLKRLAVTANASDVDVDASGASVEELSAAVNVGSLSVRLPGASDLTGTLGVGAGDLRICAPPGLGLRVTSTGTGEQVSVSGLEQTGTEWQSLDYETATHRADLTVRATFGAIEINPIGGCS